MALEHAPPPVLPGREDDFEAAFPQARDLTAAVPGFRRLSVSRCLERPATSLLLVEWDSLEDHSEGFRGSAAHQRRRELLHDSYGPFPTVEHLGEGLTTSAVRT